MPIAELSTIEAIGLVASAVSIALAIFAIWQASTFYRWSDAAAKESSDSARDLRASVERIEKLFDTFYSDTFGLMKETYADFRKHSWGESHQSGEELDQAVERAAGEKIEDLRRNLRADLEKVTEQGERADAAIADMRKELSHLLDQAIDRTRRVEVAAEEDVARTAVEKRLNELRSRGQRRMQAYKFARPLMDSGISLRRAFGELYKMRDEGEVNFEIDPEVSGMGVPEAEDIMTFRFS